ncbi:hypothetical protein GCM10007392_37820 [Saccharospirillum salsuginis]|uniref:Uncharacterized protein n=1 Tax=Saccharospirillum salsuginis TaxID=418750 RepID=A0A918KK41_9GAMM|nr:hypothetical protein GCM10007392_37820 [Saccharospirillum salsuginis]
MYVSLYGRHTRLALPVEPGSHRYVEYGVGDWRYYALAERHWTSGVRALLLSRQTALSKRSLNIEPGAVPKNRLRSERTVAIIVPADTVPPLAANLQTLWRNGSGPTIERYGHSYRKIRRDYGLLRNSNRQTALWLEQLDCRVEGFVLWSEFEVRQESSP